MSRRAALPLNDEAVDKSDDEFYEKHPELVKEDGERIPLDPHDRKQAKLRSEWMDLYEKNNKPKHKPKPKQPKSTKKPADVKQTCLPCREDEGQLVVKVVDPDGNPVKDARVTASGMQKKTNAKGVADFGTVPVKTYDIRAEKDDWKEFGPYANTVTVVSQECAEAELGLRPCRAYTLKGKPLLIGKAEQPRTIVQTVDVPDSVGGPLKLDFGEDITHGTNGNLFTGVSVGDTEEELKDDARWLPRYFDLGHSFSGMARREFEEFLSKKSSYQVYSDPALDQAVADNDVSRDYPERALGAAGTQYFQAGKTRIHQALQVAGWDVNNAQPVTNLGAPAFNRKVDLLNGLTVMIDSVQYVLIFVEQYEYNTCEEQYTIHLVFEIYDVFGLDDDDLRKFGATNRYVQTRVAAGFTAWWQLQHQYDYYPLITKATIKRTFTISTR